MRRALSCPEHALDTTYSQLGPTGPGTQKCDGGSHLARWLPPSRLTAHNAESLQ